MSRIKEDCLSFAVSVQQGFRYFKAILVGQERCAKCLKECPTCRGTLLLPKQVKKMRAKNEKEATEADLIAEKMQVDAADAAERTKNQLQKSN